MKRKSNTSKELDLHLMKENKDLVKLQKELAYYTCDKIMERVKEQIHDINRDPTKDQSSILNFYRLNIINQIRFMAEASDLIEAAYREEIESYR